MNSYDLDRLGKLMEEGTVPEWVRSYVQQNRQKMIAQLEAGQSIELSGPDGEKILIESTVHHTAA